MKYIIIGILNLFGLFQLGAQTNVEIIQSKNSSLIQALNRAEIIAENREPWLMVRIYRVDNGIGSAGFSSSEVSHSILVAVSEIDDAPQEELFIAGPFLNPIFLQWEENEKDAKIFGVLVGTANNRKKLIFQVSLEGLLLQE